MIDEKWLNKIHCMDCLEGMKQLPDESIDLIVTDPPYSGLQSKSRGSGRFSQAEHHIDFDDMTERAFLLFIKPIFKEVYRVMKVGSHFYCFTDWKQLRNMMDCIELSSLKLINLICWDKRHFGTGAGYRSQSEYILVFSKGINNKFNLNNVGNVIRCKRSGGNYHPHEKPLDLLNIFISNSTILDNLVLDPFMGSGTTAVACKQLNRNFIGFEIEQKYVEIANKRLQQEALHNFIS